MRRAILLLLLLAIAALAYAPDARAQAQRGPQAKLDSFRARTYEVLTDQPRDKVQWIVDHMEAMASVYLQTFPDFPVRDAKPVRLLLFGTNEAYLAYLASLEIDARNTSGLYFHSHAEAGLATFLKGHDRLTMLQVLQHEGFHQFANMRIGENLPTWVNEGLAEYFGQSIYINGKMETGVAPESRLKRINAAIKSRRSIPFQQMLDMSHEDWNNAVSKGGDRAGFQYDQAWSMVHFLMLAGQGKYARPFHEFIRLLWSGMDKDRAFKQAFGASDGASFEAAWRTYLQGLKADSVSAAIERLEFYAIGLRTLHHSAGHPESLEELRSALNAIGFVLRTTEGHTIKEVGPDEPGLFDPPPEDKPGRRVTMEFVKPKDKSLPASVLVKGLRVPVRIDWRAEKGKPAYDIVFK